MIAVIIPVYNRGEELKEALTSLVIQTDKKFITVVVDDNSSEDIEKIVDPFRQKLHLCYIKKLKNEGPGPARQTGLNWAYSRNIEMVTFLDGDDVLYPQAIERLAYEIRHTNADVISGQITQNKDKMDSIIPADNMTWMHGKMYRTSFLQRNEIHFDDILKTNEDVSFNLQACLLGKMFLIEEPLYLWKRSSNSLTGELKTLKAVASVDYITAIFLAAKKIPDNKKIVEDAFNCYNYYQNTKILIGEVPEKTKEEVKYLLNLPLTKETWRNDKRMSRIMMTIKPGDFFNKKMIWYSQSFIDWVHEFMED